MAEGVVLSSDQGDADDRLVTSSGRRVRDTELARSTGSLDWAVDSPNVLRRLVMGQDASNAFTATASAGQLLFTATAAGSNQHEAWIFPDSLAVNSEIESEIGLADTLGAGVAQWGNIHAIYRDAAGLWHAVAVWTDTTIPLPTLVNFGVITFDGVTMNINNFGQNGIPSALDSLRYLRILRAQRATNVVTLDANGGWLPPVGSTGDLVSNADTTFHVTGGTVTAVDKSRRTFTYAQVAGNATDAVAGGTWQPATKWATIPLKLRSRLQGNVLSALVYRPEDSPPDWANATSFTLSGGSPAFVAGEGFSAYWVAHIESGNIQRYRSTTWKRLPS
jgi:hypothetical protein